LITQQHCSFNRHGTLPDVLPDGPLFIVIGARPGGDFIQRTPTATAPRLFGVDLANVIAG
jgi:hypothetical protein